MVSKSQLKLITSLQQKKYRQQSGLFVAEGPKVIDELIDAGLSIKILFSTEKPSNSQIDFQPITTSELEKISFQKTPNTSLALFKIPEVKFEHNDGLKLALDAIRDPGNLGTIIRLCDWFGIEELICTNDTVDCYNPKVIQATMGSIARVKIVYTNLSEYLQQTNMPVYGAFMDGTNVYRSTLPKNAILVMGNEANGISDEINALVSDRISIPRFGKLQETESLNVATATAILLSEFKRPIEK